MKKPIYPYDGWKIIEESFDVETNYRDETIFTTGNGYIGMRGNFEEGYYGPPETSLTGIYLNGFYESEPIRYGEAAYGYARSSQTMLNVTDSKIIKLLVDGEPLNLFRGKIIRYRRTLDMQAGILTREVDWESPGGRQVRLVIHRLVCLTRKHLAAINYTVVPLNFTGRLTVISALDGAVKNKVNTGDPRMGCGLQGQVLLTQNKEQAGTFAALCQKTRNTGFSLVCAMENVLETENEYQLETTAKEQTVAVEFHIKARQMNKVSLYKYITYFTSRDYPENELRKRARAEVETGKELGFAKLQKAQREFLDHFWQRSDVQIKGDIALQQGLRFNAFQLLQSAGRDGKTNIGAKGLTGEGYEGHYFWDTEIYIFPFFLYTHPKISKKLLEYRYHILDKARARAKEMSQPGALYAWRTINGEETSPYYPAGTAQYHINADIIYALKKYMQATGDMEFFLHAGAEMLFETARLWADLSVYIPQKGFCINEVTGPDEYTALVNNNFFTNIMAKGHLEYACAMARLLQAEYPREYHHLAEKIGLQEQEIQDWQRSAEKMYLPVDDELGIFPQDDSFLNKAVWDFAGTPPENYPLLLHYHPLVIYRYQVLKQADVVLALFLQGNRFSTAEKKRNFDYYEAITTHDSSLSPCIHSIVAAEIGYLDKAYDYFMRTARMDLDDYNDNVKDGIHAASMAGTWLSIVCGFAGLREYDGQLYFNPVLPEKWDGYRFRITFRARLLEVDISPHTATYTLLTGTAMTIRHMRKKVFLAPGQKVCLDRRPVLEAIIFDLDGVITNTAEYHYRAWKKLADEISVYFDRRINERLKGVGRKESLEIILENSGTAFTEEEKKALAAKKNGYYQALVQQITPSDLLPGVMSLLRQLKTEGIKIALASASKNAPDVIDKLQVGGYFDAIVDAAQLSKGKPDPEIFFTAADLLEVPYRHCIGVEDAAAGITAIKSAGMFAVGVGDRQVLHQADWVVTEPAQITLAELVKRFKAGQTKSPRA